MKKLLFILFLTLCGVAHSQQHDWAKEFVPTSSVNNANTFAEKIDIDSNNNSYVIGIHSNSSFTVDVDTISYFTSPTNNTYIAKFATTGKLIWTKSHYVHRISGSGSVQLRLTSINLISDNKILVAGYFQTSNSSPSVLRLSPTDSIIPTIVGTVGFYVIYDSIGNITKYGKMFDGGQVLLPSKLNTLYLDNQKNIYYACLVRATNSFYSDKRIETLTYGSASSTLIPLVFKISPEFDSILWYKEIASEVSSDPNSIRLEDLCIGLDNNLYIAALLSKRGTGTIVIDSVDFGQSLPNDHNKGALIVLSPSGNFIHKGFINADLTQQDNIFSVFAIDTSHIYITGFLQDSLLYGNRWFRSLNPSAFSGYAYVTQASLTKAKWVNITSNNMGGSAPFNYSTFRNYYGGLQIIADKNDHVYICFFFTSSLSIGGLTASGIGTYFTKFDSLGNALWLMGGVTVNDMQVDMDGNLVYCGSFYDSLDLPPFYLYNTYNISGFLAKITDYSITRGEVSAGPYCAGDSMDIPYTRKGKYDPDNWFIAQLSDENGNFDDTSKVRELGRVKSTEDSTIRGELPLFQVSSSANYRIRVISTSPPVQSFYKKDSLRLLIYSRDKADPGPPELACFGDSFQLHTYGGTVWEWSPAYLMDDSTSRTPKVLTLQDTVFRIVISDTSGCGEPDTAFKRIIIRDNPKVEITDSFKVCLDEEVALNASFKNGDSLGYNWTWYNVVRANDWREIASDSFALVDTLLYRHNTTATRRLAIVLGDNCSIIKDTAEFVVTLKPIKIKGEISTLDSLQCDGSLVELFGNISGGDSATYSWEWFEIDEQNIPVFLDSGKGKFADTISVQLNKSIFDSRKFAFVTKDECLPYIDSSFIELKIDRRVPEAVVFPRDTAICPSTSAEIIAQISDGSGKGFRWKWIDEKGNILSQDSGNVSETKAIIKPIFNNQDSQRFWFIVEDICSPESDTQEFVISPLPPLKISDLSYGNAKIYEGGNHMLSGVEACFKELLNFTAKGIGGTSENYQWSWKIFNPDNNIMLNSFQHLPKGNSDSLIDYEPSELLRKLLVTLTLQDGCMEKGDSISFEVIIREPLKAQVLNFAQKSANDTSVCSGSELKFFANGTGGVEEDYEFTWLLDDEEISKDNEIEINSRDFKNLDAILTLILQDDCSVLADTQRINLHTLPELKAEFSAPDTICLGEEISLAAQGFGGIQNQYQFTWLHKKDDGTLEVLKNAETLDLNSKTLISESQYSQFNSREVLLVLRDNCSSPNDTFSRKIIIRPELSLTLSSSTICANPNAILTANPKGGNQNSYSINWFDKNGNPLGNGLTQTASPEGFDKFSATLLDNCSSENATAEIKVDRVPELLSLKNTPSEGCQPLPVIFEPKTNYPDKYGFEINFGNNNSENASEGTSRIDYTYKTAGTFTPSLKITTQNGCKKTIQGTPVTVYPKPIADFSFEPEDPDMDNPFVQFINQSYGAKSYIWTLGSFGDFTEENPEIEYQDTGYHNVRLIAISDKNCSDTTESQIYIKTNYRVFLPSAFSPNGDGLNDDFKPSVRGFSELDFRVYSRWGELVFHSTKDEAWDGTFNGEQMPDGVYAFTLSVINVFGEKQFFKGTVTLVR